MAFFFFTNANLPFLKAALPNTALIRESPFSAATLSLWATLANFTSTPPIAGRVVSSHVCLDAILVSDDSAAMDLFEGFENAAVPMAIVIRGKQKLLLFCLPNNGITFGSCNSQGFFADDMSASAQALKGEFCVGVVWGDDDDEIDI